MIDGYVTFDELQLITGFSENYLKKLIVDGLKIHAIIPEGQGGYKFYLYNLKEVEKWLSIHIY